MKSIAVIPARAGSKGIPGKNLRKVAGKSLLAWSITAAQKSTHNLRVIISTDGLDIAEEAKRQGAEVIIRPEEISGDKASSESALLHVLDELETTEGEAPELMVFLQCTSPLTTAADIDGTIEVLLKENADSALAVVPFHYFLWKAGTAGNWEGINHDKKIRLMRQERKPEFLESGAVYAMRTAGFRQARHRFFGKTAAYVMPAENRWEIDEPGDLIIAEMLLGRQKMTGAFRPAAVVFDFDGVLTDNAVWVNQSGVESVRCDRGDGMGIEMLRQAGMPMLILSKERNPVVTARAEKLGLPVLQGVDNKPEALMHWAGQKGFPLNQIAYVGNDMNDLECMNLVGFGIAVADAHPAILRTAKIILSRPGGHGSVRELAELILTKTF